MLPPRMLPEAPNEWPPVAERPLPYAQRQQTPAPSSSSRGWGWNWPLRVLGVALAFGGGAGFAYMHMYVPSPSALSWIAWGGMFLCGVLASGLLRSWWAVIIVPVAFNAGLLLGSQDMLGTLQHWGAGGFSDLMVVMALVMVTLTTTIGAIIGALLGKRIERKTRHWSNYPPPETFL